MRCDGVRPAHAIALHPEDIFMAPPKVYKNFIDGEWVDSVSGRTFENLNPANTKELVGIFQKSNTQDVDNAIAAAKEAFK